MSDARPLTSEEYTHGHAPCKCGEFTHIFSNSTMQRLPKDYRGELCPQCNLFMCRLSMLAERSKK